MVDELDGDVPFTCDEVPVVELPAAGFAGGAPPYDDTNLWSPPEKKRLNPCHIRLA